VKINFFFFGATTGGFPVSHDPARWEIARIFNAYGNRNTRNLVHTKINFN